VTTDAKRTFVATVEAARGATEQNRRAGHQICILPPG
jgi:hypothetical protein